MVPKGGLEPPQCCHRWILSPLRLPVPPLRHRNIIVRFWCVFYNLAPNIAKSTQKCNSYSLCNRLFSVEIFLK